jgi:hypothetical protein
MLPASTFPRTRDVAKLYHKIGFALEDNPGNAASWTARAGKELLTDSPIVALIENWQKRQKK